MENVLLQTRPWRRWGERLSGWVGRPWPWMVVIVVGLAARFHQYLGNPSFWYDEASLVASVFEFSWLKLIGPLPGRTITPPFFLWVLRGCYLSLGPQEWALRLPAFVSSLAALLLMVPMGRRWLGSPGWLWAVGFLALSTHCINHAVEVRPYATDLLITVTVLLAAHAYLRALTSRERWGAGGGLLLTAALAPWFSFTSAFVLAAVSLALLVQYVRQRSPGRLTFWLSLNVLLLLTSFLVWFFQARHLYYPGLKQEWTSVWGGFPPDHSLGTLLRWTGGALVELAHYATTGMGIPLLLLATAGAVSRWRRSWDEAVLVAGPIVVTYLASLAGKYPFADRTIFFLAPCVWLLAVEGLLLVAQRLPAAAAGVVPLLLIALVTPGLVKAIKVCARVEPMMEYREAMVFVHEHRSEEDAVWDWSEELRCVYVRVFPWLDLPSSNTPHNASEAARLVLSRPIWVIVPNSDVEDMIAPLRCLPVHQTLCRQFLGLKVLRFEPDRGGSAAEPSSGAAD